MTQEFIPYEQALELKELGFDEPCFGTYLSSFQSDWKVYELILEMGMNEEFEDNRNVYLLEGACSAPTFSQAFRWFRERYQIDSWIYPNHNGLYSVSIVRRGVGLGNLSQYQTYPEAELSCLIKLIEITNESKRT